MVCAPGFTRVCPMMEEGCPPETEKVCPKGMEEEETGIGTEIEGGQGVAAGQVAGGRGLEVVGEGRGVGRGEGTGATPGRSTAGDAVTAPTDLTSPEIEKIMSRDQNCKKLPLLFPQCCTESV